MPRIERTFSIRTAMLTHYRLACRDQTAADPIPVFSIRQPVLSENHIRA
jgi:hypothetical protein